MNLPISIASSSTVPIYRQIYDRLREAILAGVLTPGTRLESTRVLAQQLGVARTTVTTAYELLIGEGYLEARRGAWTFVAADLPDHQLSRSTTGSKQERGSRPKLNRTAAWLVRRARAMDDPFEREVEYNFRRTSTPAVDAFPVAEWRRLVNDYWRGLTPAAMTALTSRGDAGLREQIARHIRASRGIVCDRDQIVITSGNEQSIDILARIILRPAARVAVEDPSRTAVQTLFSAHGATLLPVPVDDDGIVVDALASSRHRRPSVVYVTPTHQYPTGVVLTLPRRLALLRWATAHRALVVEDDFDSEFSYEGMALEALQALDTDDVVVYVGTFMKILSASIRLSYIVVPPSLVEGAIAAQRIGGRQTEAVHQAVLARFMETGGFARHLRRLRRVHLARRDCLISALRDEFGDDVVIGPARSGVHLHVRWRSHTMTVGAMQRALAVGVSVVPIRPMCIRPPAADPGIVMAFASLPEAHIREGVHLLGHALRQRR